MIQICKSWIPGFPICKPCLDVRQNPSRDTHFPSYGRRPIPKPKTQNPIYTVPSFFPYFLCNWNLFFTPKRLYSANFLMKLWSQIVFSVSLLHQVSPSSRLILCQAPPTIPFLPSLIMRSVGNRCPKVVKYSLANGNLILFDFY